MGWFVERFVLSEDGVLFAMFVLIALTIQAAVTQPPLLPLQPLEASRFALTEAPRYRAFCQPTPLHCIVIGP